MTTNININMAYVRTNTNQPHTKSNPKLNPTAKQLAICMYVFIYLL